MNDMVNRYMSYKDKYDKTLILNPTENIPWKTELNIDFLEGLYISEDERGVDSKVIFGGGESFSREDDTLYRHWNSLVSAEVSSFKPNSGLDAHILIFMSVAAMGNRVLFLPEHAGGHFAAREILTRLGLQIQEIPVDYTKYSVDIQKTKKIIESWHPDFIFIDRSEGLNYEGFSWLGRYDKCVKIFDASQYLSHIMAGDYINPFDMGFDIMLSTLHKNYPGPQKAVIFSKHKDNVWAKIEHGLRTYVSNCHSKDIFHALLTLPSKDNIAKYSKIVLENAQQLYEGLAAEGLNIIPRNNQSIGTQHIWIKCGSKHDAYQAFNRLNKANLHVNYRLLPYRIGQGLRLGTAGATRQGLRPEHCEELSHLIERIILSDMLDERLVESAEKLIYKVKTNVEK